MKMNFNTISVAPVWALEAGDMIGFEFIGSVTSGKIGAIVASKINLTPAQIDYLKSENIDIPENDWEPVGGSSMLLVFGEFHAPGVTLHHMFLDNDRNVAVFHTNN